MTSHTPPAYVVGVDFGTLSGRAVVVRARDGEELGTAVYTYPHAVIERLLPVPAEQPAYRKNRPHSLFVTNLDFGSEQFADVLKQAWEGED